LFPARHFSYVYLSHGVAWCFNVVAERGDVGAGVLIRALEPLEGIERMRAGATARPLRDLCPDRDAFRARSTSTGGSTASYLLRTGRCGSRRRIARCAASGAGRGSASRAPSLCAPAITEREPVS